MCVCSRGDGSQLDFIPKLSSRGLNDTRSKYLDTEAPYELRCLPVYQYTEATGQLGVLYLQHLNMYTVSNQNTRGEGGEGQKLTYCTDELASLYSVFVCTQCVTDLKPGQLGRPSSEASVLH